MPDVFDSSDTFDEWFAMGKGGGQSENVIRKLHQVGFPVFPFSCFSVGGGIHRWRVACAATHTPITQFPPTH